MTISRWYRRWRRDRSAAVAQVRDGPDSRSRGTGGSDVSSEVEVDDDSATTSGDADFACSAEVDQQDIGQRKTGREEADQQAGGQQEVGRQEVGRQELGQQKTDQQGLEDERGSPMAAADSDRSPENALLTRARLDQALCERARLVRLCVYALDRTPSSGVAERLSEGLGDVGVVALRPAGVPFDPAEHEAGMVLDTDDSEWDGVIAETEVVGFADREGVLRAPVVAVYRLRDQEVP